MRATFASYSEPTELERGNTATFYVEAFRPITSPPTTIPIVEVVQIPGQIVPEPGSLRLDTAYCGLLDPTGTVHMVESVVTSDGTPSSVDYPLNVVGIWSWAWTAVTIDGSVGSTSGTITVRDNAGN